MKVAANAALPIPALKPIAQDPQEPVKLRPSPTASAVKGGSQPAGEHHRQQPGNEDDAGLGDAFSRAAGDAFRTSTVQEDARNGEKSKM